MEASSGNLHVLMRKHSDDKVQEVLLGIAPIECCSDIFLL